MIPEEHKEAHEVQFLDWGESKNAAPWIKLRVTPETYEWFKAFNAGNKNSQRFYMVAVPIDDNEEPKPAPVFKERKPFHELSRAQQAGVRCNDAGFQQWLNVYFDLHWPPSTDNSTAAASFVRAHCQVVSRAEIDTDANAADVWDALDMEYCEATQLPEQR